MYKRQLLQSLIQGEQLRTQVALNWFENLNGANIRARVVEADNSALIYSNGTAAQYPTMVKSGVNRQNLAIRYQYRAGSGTGGTVLTSDYTVVLPEDGTNIPAPTVGDTVATEWVQYAVTGEYRISLTGDFATNCFEIIWDDRISQQHTQGSTNIAAWSPAPEPNRPVYGFFGLEVRDSGSGETQQIWKPLRGLIEVRYSVNI